MKSQRRPTRLVRTGVEVTILNGSAEGSVLACDLTYDPTDPFAMSFVFKMCGQAPIRWTFARDLVLRGLDEPSGMGDVLVRPWLSMEGRAEVAVTLSSPEGELVLQASRRDVQCFVDAMLEAVPEGEECRAGAVDAELDGILG